MQIFQKRVDNPAQNVVIFTFLLVSAGLFSGRTHVYEITRDVTFESKDSELLGSLGNRIPIRRFSEYSRSEVLGVDTRLEELIVRNVSLEEDVDNKIDQVDLLPLLPDFRSPCWLESLPGVDPYGLDTHPYVKYFARLGKLQRSYLKYLVKSIERYRQRYETGGKWRMRCLPSLYVIGVFKSGTTSLWGSLVQNHRQLIQGPPHKEPQYWNSVRTGGGARYFGWSKNMDLLNDTPPPRFFRAYVDLFDNAAEHSRMKTGLDELGRTIYPTIIGDASPIYLTEYDFWQQIPQNRGLPEPKYILAHLLKSLTPDIKVVIMLRDPVDRLYSQYLFYDKAKSKSPEAFHELATEALDLMMTCLRSRSLRSCSYDYDISRATTPIALRQSLYLPFVRDWKEVFGKNVLILNSEEYFRNQGAVVNDVYRFLGLPVEGMNFGPRNNNVKYYRRVGPMLNHTRQMLTSFYRPYNEKLAVLLGDPKYRWHKEDGGQR